MRAGISITVTPKDRRRLQSVIADRNAPQKLVWRSQIILLTAAGAGTNAIMEATGKAKTCVWRWQERFMTEGVDGLLRDKTRPSRIPALAQSTIERVLALTHQPPPHAASHWTAVAMAKASGVSASSVQRIETRS
jgi:transposase